MNVTQDLTYPELKKLIADEDGIVPKHKGRFMVRVKYKKYIRSHGQFHPGHNERFEIGQVERYYDSARKLLKWADRFPRNRLLRPIEVLVKTKDDPSLKWE